MASPVTLDTIYSMAVSRAEQRRLASRLMACQIFAAGAPGQAGQSFPQTSTLAPLEQVEAALAQIATVNEVDKINISDAKQWLRDHHGDEFASRLAKATNARNGVGHPDVYLLADLMHFIAALGNASDFTTVATKKRLTLAGLQHETDDKFRDITQRVESLAAKLIDIDPDIHTSLGESKYANCDDIARLTQQVTSLAGKLVETDVKFQDRLNGSLRSQATCSDAKCASCDDVTSLSEQIDSLAEKLDGSDTKVQNAIDALADTEARILDVQNALGDIVNVRARSCDITMGLGGVGAKLLGPGGVPVWGEAWGRTLGRV